MIAELGRAALALWMAAILSPAWAGETWIVDDDDSPHAQFHDIQSAIDAAGPGDCVLVYNGVYDGFVLNRDLAILGYALPGVTVTGTISVTGAPRAAIARLRFQRMVVQQCTGTVALQHLDGDELDVSTCVDVRLLDVYLEPALDGRTALEVIGSRVEVVESTLRGSDGDEPFSGDGGYGGDGVVCAGASLVHLVKTTVRGGDGGDGAGATAWGGDGGDALRAVSGARAILAGDDSTTIRGGTGGMAYRQWGEDGCAMNALGATSSIRYSGIAVIGLGQCGNGSFDPTVPDDPLLRPPPISGPGQPRTFEVIGTPGHHAYLVFGRAPAVVPTPGIVIERLVVPERVLDLGLIPPAGHVRHDVGLAAVATPLGSTDVVQAETVAPGGALRRTNSALTLVEQQDCNGNRRPDAQDIATGLSEDCNDDEMPDECEADCNGNGRADVCDIVSGFSDDCDGNGVPDECEADCNANGVNDLCELGDCNENGVLDACDIALGTSDDCDASGVPDECELSYVLRQNVLPPPGAVDGFGEVIAWDGDVLLVSAMPAPWNIGTVHSFRRAADGSGWDHQWTIDENVGRFGQSIDIDGNRAVVGARGTGGVWAYAYRRIASGALVFEAALNPDDESGGGDVAISDDALILGAPASDGSGWSNGGAAYVYRRYTGGWVLETMLTASDADGSDEFGTAVEIDGDVAVVGAPLDETNGFLSGAVYVFRHDGAGSWIEEAKLVPAGVGEGDRFGRALTLDGDRLVVAAPNADLVVGDGLYAFEHDGASWVESDFIPNPHVASSFGIVLDLRGDLLVVGVPDGSLSEGLTQGFADAFRRQSDGTWLLEELLERTDLTGAADMGRGVATDGFSIVVGAPQQPSRGEVSWFVSGDCNANGIPDACDIADGTSNDQNGNAVPDECEP